MKMTKTLHPAVPLQAILYPCLGTFILSLIDLAKKAYNPKSDSIQNSPAVHGSKQGILGLETKVYRVIRVPSHFMQGLQSSCSHPPWEARR
jgi:hypothetical protein